MSESAQQDFQTIGNLASSILPNAQDSDLTATSLPMASTGSETTTDQRGACLSIGTRPSSHGLETLRDLARSVNKGHLLNDQTLETLLVQHFGQQRISVKREIVHSYGDDGYNARNSGIVVEIDGLGDCEMQLFDALDYLNRPASEAFSSAKIAQLRAVMARTRESQGDIDLVVETYAEHLSQFPPDVVAFVVDRCIATKKWFPLVSELRSEMEEIVMFRKAVMKAFEKARNLFSSNGGQKMIEAPKPKPVYYNDPRQNPKRRVMCDFLMDHGREDLFELTRLYTNYDLEIICRSLGMEQHEPERTTV